MTYETAIATYAGPDLSGSVALVTGAGRARGMGRATALALAHAGADVIVTDIGKPRRDLEHRGIGLGDSLAEIEFVADLVRGIGRKSLALPLDITDARSVSKVIAEATDTLGTVDILVNNAGTAVGAKPFLELRPDDLDLSWGVNVQGTINVTQAVVPGMMTARRGSIINIASTLGIAAMAGYGSYVLTKHALVGLTRLLSQELGPHGIRTNAVAPGFIGTDMGDAEKDFIAAQLGGDVEAAAVAINSSVPLGRSGLPDEVAQTTTWLASSAASFVNGAVIPVSGGQIPGFF